MLHVNSILHIYLNSIAGKSTFRFLPCKTQACMLLRLASFMRQCTYRSVASWALNWEKSRFVKKNNLATLVSFFWRVVIFKPNYWILWPEIKEASEQEKVHLRNSLDMKKTATLLLNLIWALCIHGIFVIVCVVRKLVQMHAARTSLPKGWHKKGGAARPAKLICAGWYK